MPSQQLPSAAQDTKTDFIAAQNSGTDNDIILLVNLKSPRVQSAKAHSVLLCQSLFFFGTFCVILGAIMIAMHPTVVYTGSRALKFAILGDRCGPEIAVALPFPSLSPSKVSGLCCSGQGYAGYTEEHCGIGCQAGFGRCELDASNLNLPPIYKRCQNPKDFALTFDGGPSEFTASLLDYLKSAGVKATFFMNGHNWKQNYSIPFSKNQSVQRSRIFERADVVKRVFQEGHQICSHTYSHIDITKNSPYNVTYEISRLNHHFAQIIGQVPTCFRPPYDDFVSNVSLKILQGFGYDPSVNGALISYSFDSFDWNGSDTNSQLLGLSGNLKNISAGAISLNHDVSPVTADFRANGSMIPNGIKPFAQEMIEYLKANGWNLVTVDKCLGFKSTFYRNVTPSDYVCGDSNSWGRTSCNA